MLGRLLRASFVGAMSLPLVAIGVVFVGGDIALITNGNCDSTALSYIAALAKPSHSWIFILWTWLAPLMIGLAGIGFALREVWLAALDWRRRLRLFHRSPVR